MKCEVQLYVAGKVFTEQVYAVDYDEARRVALARNPNARVVSVNAKILIIKSFILPHFHLKLDPKLGQPSGYVTKDGMWAAVPSNGRKFAIIHNGVVEHFSKNFECAMIYIKKGIQKEKKDARSKLNRSKVKHPHKNISERWIYY